MKISSNLLSSFIFLGFMALAYAIHHQYGLGNGAGFFYDEKANLEGLESVQDIDSALGFIFSGDSGPLGRPISLASFALNAPSWPAHAEDFHHTNTLIHLLNGVLLFWLIGVFAQIIRPRCEWPWIAAGIASLLWLAHPLWVSAVHIPVQRMTLLAATFSLLGLIGYIKARAHLESRPNLALGGMSASLMLGTALAALSKENGALLPLFALALELALAKPVFANDRTARLWWTWKTVFLYAPPALLLGYLAWPIFADPVAHYAIREFTLYERLLTQPRILWDYIGYIFFPRPNAISPFHDDIVVSTGLFTPFSTLVSILAWLAVIVLAWRWKTRYPLFAMAILWFLGGHGLESTFIPLELYFEHRNYLPSMGLFVLAGLAAAHAFERSRFARRVTLIFVPVYFVVCLFALHVTNTLWGAAPVAAQIWHERQPESVRAAQHLARLYLVSGQTGAAFDMLRKAMQRAPTDTGLILQGFRLGCERDEPASIDEQVQKLIPVLRQGFFSTAALVAVDVMEKNLGATCTSLTDTHLLALIDALAANPKFQASRQGMANLFIVRSRIHARRGEFSPTVETLEAAFERAPSLNLIQRISLVLSSGGLHDIGLQRIEEYRAKAPRNPVLRAQWNRELDAMREVLLANKAQSDAGERTSP